MIVVEFEFVHVYTIQEMGDNSTDSVPPCQLVGAADQLFTSTPEHIIHECTILSTIMYLTQQQFVTSICLCQCIII